MDTRSLPDKGRVQATKPLWLPSHCCWWPLITVCKAALETQAQGEVWEVRGTQSCSGSHPHRTGISSPSSLPQEGEVWACTAPQQRAESRGLMRSLSPFCNLRKINLSLGLSVPICKSRL